MNLKKFFASALSWLFGAFFFAGLNLYLLLKKITKSVSTQKGAYNAPVIVRFNTPISLGGLPNEINKKKMYQIPDNVPPETKSVVLEISASTQPKQLSEEFELTVFTGKDTRIHFFLFLKPFENKPELSYAIEEIQIKITENRKFEIQLEGRTGMKSDFTGGVKIIGYC